MSNNMKVLIIGAGTMAREYCKVVNKLEYEPVVIGRGRDSAESFEKDMNIPVYQGGISENIDKIKDSGLSSIVAVTVDQLSEATCNLINNGVKNILVEKPAGMTYQDIEKVCELANKNEANIFVAYNRRFYASTQKAMEIINEDGGVSSFNFEFTEWGHVIEKENHSAQIKENWFLANSTHVVDLAFFLGGFPKEMKSYVKGKLNWHSNGSIYAGCGISDKDALFSYQANWGAPGRWSVEILTSKHRLYFKPMEKLQIQEIGSVAINPIEIDDELDILFKPGLFCQTRTFLSGTKDPRMLTINEHLEHMKWYNMIEQV